MKGLKMVTLRKEIPEALEKESLNVGKTGTHPIFFLRQSFYRVQSLMIEAAKWRRR
jgi:hypothetical protein